MKYVLVLALSVLSTNAQVVLKGAVLKGGIIGTTNFVNSGGGGSSAMIFIANAKGTAGGCVTAPATNTASSTIFIAAIRGYRSPYPKVSTDTHANTWTQLTGVGGSGAGATINYAISPTTGGSDTFTIDGGDAGTQFSGAGVYGFSGITAFDSQSAGFTSGGIVTIQPGSITPAGAGEVFVSIVTTDNVSEVFSIDSGWTLDFQGVLANTFTFAVAHKIKGAADSAAENPTWTRVSGDPGPVLTSIQACFKP